MVVMVKCIETNMSYLSKRFVLKLLLVLKESVQAVFLHNDL